MATQQEIKNASLKVNTEFFSLEPSSIISLFEVDLTNLGIANVSQFIINLRNFQLTLPGTNSGIFNYSVIRLHNNLKLGRNIIYWKGNAYLPAPLSTEGFELASRGVFPKPKVQISFSDDMLDVFSLFRGTVNFGDLIGAKFTRIRTFAKFLDRSNFYQSDGVNTLSPDKLIIPDGFDPDPNCEFPRDVYYFDRKSSENKNSIQFELSSAIDLDRVRLPKRRVLSYICPWQYRGEGCLYEYKDRLNEDVHGTATAIPNKSDSSGVSAPVCGTEDDQVIKDMPLFKADNIPISNDPSEWGASTKYEKGNVVFISKKGINFYFVAKSQVPINIPPPNGQYWLADQCSKSVKGCKIRFGENPLPFGGFYGVSNYNRGAM
jgi:lambda family phage minor tail protein L